MADALLPTIAIGVTYKAIRWTVSLVLEEVTLKSWTGMAGALSDYSHSASPTRPYDGRVSSRIGGSYPKIVTGD